MGDRRSSSSITTTATVAAANACCCTSSLPIFAQSNLCSSITCTENTYSRTRTPFEVECSSIPMANGFHHRSRIKIKTTTVSLQPSLPWSSSSVLSSSCYPTSHHHHRYYHEHPSLSLFSIQIGSSSYNFSLLIYYVIFFMALLLVTPVTSQNDFTTSYYSTATSSSPSSSFQTTPINMSSTYTKQPYFRKDQSERVVDNKSDDPEDNLISTPSSFVLASIPSTAISNHVINYTTTTSTNTLPIASNYTRLTNRNSSSSTSQSHSSYENDSRDDGKGSSLSWIKTRTRLLTQSLQAVSSSARSNNLTQIRRDLTRRIVKSANIDEDTAQECDRVFISTPGSPKNGTFESPSIEAEEGHSLQCIYTFVTAPGERVEVRFTEFNVRGILPDCAHEWVDVYTEVDGTDVTDLISTPFGGRYCGKIPPRPRISLYGGIAIGFYSDRFNASTGDEDEVRFVGTYSFFNEDRYIIGTPVPRTICSYTLLGTSKRQGELVSPTYPGVYPKDLSCTYKFIGTPGQRIRIEFRDFDVFAGGGHCPFDDVKIYDGMDPTAPLIGTFCGQQRYLVHFSSEHLLLITFTTLERNIETQNRGFSALWEFSESFVKLDFIGKNAGQHIRGTECDQKILSKGQSQGAVYSPNYPFPYLPKIYCRYFIYGLQDPQHLERVKLSFEKFDVPSSVHSEEDLTNQPHMTHQKHTDVIHSRCGDGNLKIFLKGQEVIQAFDKPDQEYCGKEVPHDVSSDGPRLVLVFSSGETQGSGFKARYTFETEYRVPGTAAPDGTCHFTYLSSSTDRGELNSPRFPSNYPSNMNCTYLFLAKPNEQVRIVFDHFKVRSDKVSNYTGGAYGSTICSQDWVEVYNVFKDKNRLIGRYCAATSPGPIESHEEAEGVKIILRTDDSGVYSGFKARYIFFTAQSIFGECGMNVSQSTGGILTSPGWPGKYEPPKNREGSTRCNWFLAVRPGGHVMLHFQVFSIEGQPNERGCPSAAVRIWEDPEGLPVELCGDSLPPEHNQFVSVKNLLRVTFITADKAVGDIGFLAVWTEVQDRIGSSSCPPTFFGCAKSPYCIPENLRCDGSNNCGSFDGETDHSDEDLCGLDKEINVILVVVLAGASGSCCILTLCAWSQRKRRKRRRRLQLRRPPIHVCDNAGARFAAMDSV